MLSWLLPRRRLYRGTALRSQILQLPEFAQAKKLVSVRQNDRGLFQSVPINADSYDGHFCARLIRKQ